MEFTLHTTFPDASISNEWNTLVEEGITNAPFLRYEYLKQWWQTRGGGEWQNAELMLLTATESKGETSPLLGIAPLFFETNRDGLPALLLLGSIEISDYLDVITRPKDLERFITGLMDTLDSQRPHNWSALDWYNIAETSPVIPALQAESAKRGWTFSTENYAATPTIVFNGGFEHYLASIDKKQRHELRRKIRRAEESGRDVRWYIVEDSNTLDVEIEAFFTLMAHDPDKEKFLTPLMREQMKSTAREAFNHGALQLAFLEVDNEKACAYFNLDYANRIWVYNSGLDRRFMDLSPGWVLLGYLIQWACEHQRSEFDFMRGDEDYKYKLGGQDRHVLRVKITR